MPLFFIAFSVNSQGRLKVPVSINIEDGNFDGVSVVMKNNTTGESNSIKGSAKLDLELKLNSDYIISFTKPGYITKKMAINTNAPADRAAQGFYPYDFVMNLFPQYDGLNIVIFNQPVGKVFYNRLIDDFDYDTDYTKQIQSALKAAEEELKKKQAEEKVLAEQRKKDAEKHKADSIAQAKADTKAKLEADKKAAEEAKLNAAREAKEKKAQEEQRKLEAKAMQDEEKRKAALAKLEEEERRIAKAAEEEESRPAANAVSGNDEPPSGISRGGGTDLPTANMGKGSGEEKPGGGPGKGTGKEDPPAPFTAKTGEGNNTVTTTAKPVTGSDVPAASISTSESKSTAVSDQVQYEILPEISVEEISEPSRTITRVTVRKGEKETIFSKVVYNWGGIYFFRNTMSISESLFTASTGQR